MSRTVAPALPFDPATCPPEQLLEALWQEWQGLASPGDLPMEEARERENGLNSPSHLATKIIDPWYERHFERVHYRAMDEVLAPWILGEPVRIEGVLYDPRHYTGLLVLWSRGTIKSTTARLMTLWDALYQKLRLKLDARAVYIHHVLEKAIQHGEALREIARTNQRFRRLYPEFSAPPGLKEWDTKKAWRWPCFSTTQANEFSFTAYGETSSKTGGHYTLRMADDWETDESVTNETMLAASERGFLALDQLKDRTRPYHPWIAMGTPYHYDGTYARLERSGGWLVWKVPGFLGDGKVILDLLALDPREEPDRRRIESTLSKLERERQADLNFPKILPWREIYSSARAEKAQDDDSGLGSCFREFNAQIQLETVPAGEARFPHEALDASWVAEFPRELAIHVRVDPALSERSGSSLVAINVCGIDWRGHRYFLDGFLGRIRMPSEILRRCFILGVKWQRLGHELVNLGIESVSFQEALCRTAKEGVPAREPLYHGEAVPIVQSPMRVVSITRSAEMRKQERILRMEGPVQRHEIHVWNENPIGRKIVTAFKQFPFGNMDVLDTCHDCWVQTRRPSRAIYAQDSPDRVHPLFEKLLPRHVLLGLPEPREGEMSNTVDLASW